ncbi:hypothetical protein [Granulosicoccus antarcticus]|uniref:Fibronectin type-III domain-containing protein n=1 Tax=Granulosicoccus antarcticus IMCC3135 TaxID=1192854 RepID=A0A2Z2NJX9_9GAMM|nr:hypothetical protein [Granulosicoccus antarcticus]ASJ70381.1 hypothetical protein IMCC3135_01310 [Granulosicoccus antarcticus IMCC3135]
MHLSHSLLPIFIVGLTHASIALASPTVTGQQISWPDDGWYQVQDTSTYASLCEGGGSCEVDPGTYIVINHTTGERFEGVTVSESDSTLPLVPTVQGNTISWPDDGWYQVQDASSYSSLCEGGLSCNVPAGTYNVINLTTGVRFEGLTVDVSIDPGNGPDPDDTLPSSPANASIELYYSAAELFWDRPDASERVTLTEIWRDGEFIGSTNGTSYYDDTRTQGVFYWYEFVAVDADGDRSPSSTLNVQQAQQTLLPDNPSATASYEPGSAFEGNTAVIGADQEDPAVYILTRDTSAGDWQVTQQLNPEGDIYGESFGSAIAMSGDTLMVRGTDVDEDSFLIYMLYVYTRDSSGIWNETQRIKGATYVDRDGFVIDGDTLAISRSTGIDLFERNVSSGQWELAQQIPHADGQTEFFQGRLTLDNDRLLAGTNTFEQNGNRSGGAFLYRKVAGNWELEQELIPAGAAAEYLTASSVAIDGDTIAISLASGNIAIYELDDDGIWSEVTELTGFSIWYRGAVAPTMKIEEGLLLAGYDYAHGLVKDSGQVYVYEQNSLGIWGAKTRLIAPEGITEFGSGVNMDNGEAFVIGKNDIIDNDSYYAVPEGFLFDLN